MTDQDIFEFASLGSGSSGNATIVRAGRELVLIDCGFGLKETQARLLKLGIAAAELTAIFITHEHGDHIKGAGPLARKFNIPVYTSSGTYYSGKLGKLTQVKLFDNFKPICLDADDRYQGAGPVRVHPVAVPHDAREPAQFIVEFNQRRLGILTDLGHISQHVEKAYQDCDALLLEANHCTDMLRAGPYPAQLKQRVGGNWGHLNNHQSAAFFQSVDCERLQTLVLGHISQNNNSVARVREVFEPLIASTAKARKASEPLQAYYACQDEGFDWISVSKDHVISHDQAEHAA